jgi:hypothetical protein
MGRLPLYVSSAVFVSTVVIMRVLYLAVTYSTRPRPIVDEKQALEEFIKVAEWWDYAFNLVRFSIIWTISQLASLFTNALLFIGIPMETLARMDDTLSYWITRVH